MFWVGDVLGCIFWYQDVFLWSQGGQSLLFGIEIFLGIESLHSVVQPRDPLLPGINPCVFCWGLDILYIGGQKDLDTEKNRKLLIRKKDISIPPKRVARHFAEKRNVSGRIGKLATAMALTESYLMRRTVMFLKGLVSLRLQYLWQSPIWSWTRTYSNITLRQATVPWRVNTLHSECKCNRNLINSEEILKSVSVISRV